MTIGRIPSVEGGIQPTIVDAKGDLIAGVAADSVNRLAVGSNDQVLVADSAASTGMAWKSVATPFAAGKNKIINGDFGIWQRGTSFTPTLDSFVCDRFRTYFEGSGTTRTVSRQTFTPGTAPVAGYESQYFLRYAQTVGPSAGIGNNLLMQNIEDVRTFAGQTVTFSFWAKASATTVLPLVYAYQYFGTGGSPSGNVQTTFASNVSVGTSWTRYSYTAAIPSISGKTIGTNNDGYISFRTQHPLGSGDTFTIDYWGWQVEAGSVATAFQTATGTLQGELAACQRYFQVFGGNVITEQLGMGQAYSSTQALINCEFKTTMRTSPTFSIGTGGVVGDFRVYNASGTELTLTGISSGNLNPDRSRILAVVASGLVAGDATALISFVASGRLFFSAEL